VLKLLHTADLHLGLESAQFEPDARRRLARARLDVANTILSVAEQYAVDAVLWAGDIFDTPEPGEDWWRGFAKVLKSRAGWIRPIVLLPGNHDPVKAGSVFHPDHAFRKLLPDWVHVVDSERFELALTPEAVLFAAPCTSMAGAEDLALTLPGRPEGDARIRVGLVHGSTFDMEGYQTSFPIARDAPAQRGLDYLAVGDTHGFRVITESGVAPIVYPGAPEQTRFGESGAGQVALVMLQRSGARPTVTSVKVGRWTWRDESATSLESLRSLAAEDLSTTVLRLRLDMTVSVLDEKEVDLLTRHLRGDAATSGRAGAFVLDRSGLRVEVGDVNALMKDAPETLSIVAEKLAAGAAVDDEARRALNILYRLMSEAQS
jgi:DNA repair exonuclease SbcCD nuclease subunit